MNSYKMKDYNQRLKMKNYMFPRSIIQLSAHPLCCFLIYNLNKYERLILKTKKRLRHIIEGNPLKNMAVQYWIMFMNIPSTYLIMSMLILNTPRRPPVLFIITLILRTRTRSLITFPTREY